MQEFHDSNLKPFQKFYEAGTEEELNQKMEADRKSEAAKGNTMTRRVTKIGRNQLCPCGSGKKFKKCCIDRVV